MNAYRLPHDPGTDNVSFDHVHHGEVDNHQHGCYPTGEKGNNHAHGSGDQDT